MKTNILRLIIGLSLMIWLPLMSTAQPILIDEGVYLNGVWCFPVLGEANNYKYLPTEVGLREANGKPQFSFLKYVINTEGNQDVTDAFTKAAGGAIINFVVELRSNTEEIKKAENQLKRKFGKEYRISGPVIPEKGSFMLVSSILNSQGKKDNKVLGLSNAPVLEGGSIPASFRLAEEDALLMLETLKMSASDISLVFDFTIKGLTESFSGKINYNWSQIYEYTRSKTKAGKPFFKVEMDELKEELEQTDFIEIVNNGKDEHLEQLQQVAFDKITSMLFKPVSLDEFREKKSWVKEATGAIGEILEMVKPKLFAKGFTQSYQLKNISKFGAGSIKITGRKPTERSHFLTFNMGNLYEDHGPDPAIFRTVNIDDKDFLQREVFIQVDAGLVNDFDEMFNNITIDFRKRHQDGSVTVDQKILHKSKDVELKDLPKVIYPNLKDEDLLEWMIYDYRTTWSFRGGRVVKQDWQADTAAAIVLNIPYEQSEILLSGDLESVWEKGVKVIVVELSYDFFGQKITKKQVIQKGDDLAEKQFKITHPTGQYQGTYKIMWFANQEPIVQVGTDQQGLIFIDRVDGL